MGTIASNLLLATVLERGDGGMKIIMNHYGKVLGITEDVMQNPTVIMLWSLSVAMFAVGGMVSSFTVGWIGEKMPRVRAMILVNILAVSGNIFLAVSKFGPSYVFIIIGRAFTGLHTGLTSGLAPLYVGEIAPTALRGALGSLHQLAVVIGILISQVLGLDFLLGKDETWPLLLSLAGCAAVFQTVLLFFCPESPRYLYIKCGKIEEAKESLKRLRGEAYDPTKELEDMEKEKEEASKEKPIFYYSTDIFNQAHVRKPIYATIGVGFVNTVFTVFAVFLVDKAGRRSLFMAGLFGMMLCTITMTVGLVLQKLCGPYVFLIFAVLLGIFVIFIYYKVPETKGKSFEEIAEEFRRRNKGGATGGATEMEYLGGAQQA
ncbi:Solute carrier family 2, facilitated glucose transporter member 2 [Varanus komodoensis]|nr:Solute carrier family 2, facilitated glucose transporter member 2 [Varanus komodoensis]